ncbi:hypothetical protein ACO0SA_002565 [Hanseniaspora valbyensis]
MIDRNNNIYPFINKFFGIFESFTSFIEWIHIFVKYGLISKNSRLSRLLLENKKMLKIWAVATAMDILRNIKKKRNLKLLIKKLEHRSQLILKNKEQITTVDQVKSLHTLKKQVDQLKFSYRQATWDFYESILTFFASILRVFEIKQKLVDFIERILQVIGIARIGYDLVNFGSTISGLVDTTQNFNINRRRRKGL